MGAGVGPGEVAVDLRQATRHVGEGEAPFRDRVVLARHPLPVDGAAVEARHRAGLEAADPQPALPQIRGERVRRAVADAAADGLLLAAVHHAAEEGAGGQHHPRRRERGAVGEDHARGALTVEAQRGDLPLQQRELREARELALHLHRVDVDVDLRAARLDRKPLARVEAAELDTRRVRHPAHEPAQRVELAHEVALAEAADRRVAAQPRHVLAAMADQRHLQPEPRRRRRRFAARVSGAHHHHVEAHPASVRTRGQAAGLSRGGMGRARRSARPETGVEGSHPFERAQRATSDGHRSNHGRPVAVRSDRSTHFARNRG